MKKLALTGFTLLLLITSWSCVDCQSNEKIFRDKAYDMLVKSKGHENELKFVVIKGLDQTGQNVVFKEVGLEDIYNNVNIGDKLIKKQGSVIVTIERGQTYTEFPSGCGDKHIEKPIWLLKGN